MRAIPILLALAGCTWEAGTGHQGTAVGNPGKLEMGVEVPPGTSLHEATAWVERVEMHDCEGAVERVEMGQALDLLDPAAHRITIPGGQWCGMDAVLLDDGLVLAGETDRGTPFTLTLDPGLVAVHGSFYVDGHTLLLWLSSDLDGEALESRQTGALSHDPDAPRATVAAFGVGTLWDDVDEDGRIDPDEELVELGSGDSPAAFADGGCSCQNTPPGAAGAMIALAVLFRRRRTSGNATERDTR